MHNLAERMEIWPKKKKLRRWRGESSKGEDVSDFRCRNFDVAASRDIWIFTSASVADGMSTNLLAAVDSGNAGADFFFFVGRAAADSASH